MTKISPKLYLEFSFAGKTRRCAKEGQICTWWGRCCPELKCVIPKGEKRSRCMAGKTFNNYNKNNYMLQNVFGQNVSMIMFLFKFQTNLDAQNGLHGEIARQDGEREHEEAYVRDLQQMLRNVQV